MRGTDACNKANPGVCTPSKSKTRQQLPLYKTPQHIDSSCHICDPQVSGYNEEEPGVNWAARYYAASKYRDMTAGEGEEEEDQRFTHDDSLQGSLFPSIVIASPAVTEAAILAAQVRVIGLLPTNL